MFVRDTGEYSVTALTQREREVLTCVARAYDNREIAEELVITVRTVNRHLENIRGKLGSRRRSELVRIARQIDPAWAEHPAYAGSASEPSRNVGPRCWSSAPAGRSSDPRHEQRICW